MTTSHESHEDVVEFCPQMICHASRFILKVHVTAGGSNFRQALFEKFQVWIQVVLCASGAWSTSSTDLLVEVTFKADRDLKKFLQSKKKLETSLNEIMESQMEPWEDDAKVSSIQLFLATLELPEKLCEVTLASYRKCAALYAKSKVFDIDHQVVLPAKVFEDALTDDDLSDLMIELAEVSAKWPILGLFLKMTPNTLDEIELDIPAGPGSTKRRLSSMLSKWMSSYPDEARWSTLVVALVHSELQGTARKIAEKYGVPCPNVHSERENLHLHLEEIRKLMERMESSETTLLEKQRLLKESEAEGVVTIETIESIKGSLQVAVDKAELLESQKAEVERQLAEMERQLQEQGREMKSALEKEVSLLRQQIRSNEDQLQAAAEEASRVKEELEIATRKNQNVRELEEEIFTLRMALEMERSDIRIGRQQLLSTRDYSDAMMELNEHIALQQQLQAPVRENVHVLVHTPDDKFTLDVKPTDTIRSIKSKIQLRKGIPVHQQELECVRCQHFNSVEDDKELQDYWPHYGELRLRSGYCTVS